MSQRIIFLFFVMTFAISACATVPQLKTKDLSGEVSIKKTIPHEKTIPVYIEGFTVAKTISNPFAVGEARTGGFNLPELILSDDPLHLIVTEEIKKGLHKAGFTFVEKEKAHLSVSGRIERFWVEERIGGFVETANASVRYDVIIRDRQGRLVWANTVEAREMAKSSLDVTKEDIPTLIKALKKSVASLFEDDSFWKAMEQ